LVARQLAFGTYKQNTESNAGVSAACQSHGKLLGLETLPAQASSGEKNDRPKGAALWKRPPVAPFINIFSEPGFSLIEQGTAALMPKAGLSIGYDTHRCRVTVV
jgi:hypothetical protein